jgi:glutamate formiminotransferase/formiminotetrahydrofolate cyclodeaminase
VAEHYLKIENFSRDQILENRLARHIGATEQSVAEFLDEVASAAPTPGGGSVAALAGSLASALATMVARLTIGKAKYAEHDARMRQAEAEAETLRRELFDLVQEDARAYEGFRSASRLSQRTPEEVSLRERALADAARNATSVPLRTAETCVKALAVAREVATYGNVNAVSDAGVAAWLARSGVEGAALNVRINLGDVPEQERAGFTSRLEHALAQAREQHDACLAEVDRRMRAA